MPGFVVRLRFARGDCDPGITTEEMRTAYVSTETLPHQRDWTVSFYLEATKPAARFWEPRREAQGGKLSLPAEVRDLPDIIFNTVKEWEGSLGPEQDPHVVAGLRLSLADEVVARFASNSIPDRPLPNSDAHRRLSKTVSIVLEYLGQLSATQVEQTAMRHGVVIAESPPRGVEQYPHDLRLKRTPLLFDGYEAVLQLDESARAVKRLTADEVPCFTDFYDQLGDDALTAAASHQVGGVGLLLRRDRSILLFVDGIPLLIKREGSWRALPFASIAQAYVDHAGAGFGGALAFQTALLLSIRQHGGILAVFSGDLDPDSLPARDMFCAAVQGAPVPDEPKAAQVWSLHRLVSGTDLRSARRLLPLAAIDGATVLDVQGRLLAYGAIVQSAGSQDEGARSAAARSLSEQAGAAVVLKISEDGPIDVYQKGQELLRFL